MASLVSTSGSQQQMSILQKFLLSFWVLCATYLHFDLVLEKAVCYVSGGEVSVDLAAHLQLECSLNCVAGTGLGIAPVDSSLTVAQELFAPFSEDLFSPELDVQALKGMLTQPLRIQVPVASAVFAQYCSLMPSLYCPSTTENARGLISRFDTALAQSWPTGSGSELNYTAFWDILGFKLPEFAQGYIDCGVSCSRYAVPWLVLSRAALAQRYLSLMT